MLLWLYITLICASERPMGEARSYTAVMNSYVIYCGYILTSYMPGSVFSRLATSACYYRCCCFIDGVDLCSKERATGGHFELGETARYIISSGFVASSSSRSFPCSSICIDLLASSKNNRHTSLPPIKFYLLDS